MEGHTVSEGWEEFRDKFWEFYKASTCVRVWPEDGDAHTFTLSFTDHCITSHFITQSWPEMKSWLGSFSYSHILVCICKWLTDWCFDSALVITSLITCHHVLHSSKCLDLSWCWSHAHQPAPLSVSVSLFISYHRLTSQLLRWTCFFFFLIVVSSKSPVDCQKSDCWSKYNIRCPCLLTIICPGLFMLSRVVLPGRRTGVFGLRLRWSTSTFFRPNSASCTSTLSR